MPLNEPLTPDAQAIALLCARFGEEKAKPLTPSEYGVLAQVLHRQNKRPSDLLREEGLDALDLTGSKLTADRLHTLMQRGFALAMELEALARSGIQIITRADGRYPANWKKHLGLGAPPLLYGAGNLDLLRLPSLAMVGSRDASPEALDATWQIARAAVRDDLAVVSGGAKGVDEESMQAALESSGRAIGILADSMERVVGAKRWNGALRSGHLLLISAVHPSARFHVGNAMARNRLIYTQSMAAVVVCSGLDGGTWTGAVEGMEKKWVPVYVLDAPFVPEGNRALIKRGARLLRLESLAALDAVKNLAKVAAPSDEKTSLFSDAPVSGAGDGFWKNHVLPMILEQLGQSGTAEELAASVGILPQQAELWLQRAHAEKMLGLDSSSSIHRWYRI